MLKQKYIIAAPRQRKSLRRRRQVIKLEKETAQKQKSEQKHQSVNYDFDYAH